MKPNIFFRFVIAMLATLSISGNVMGQGAVRAMYFPGSGILTPSPTATTNSFIDLGTGIRDSLATSSFTIEVWVKMGATNSVNPVIIGDKDWASGSNTGFILSYYASTDASSGTASANTIRFNFRPASGARVDYDMSLPASIAQSWNHIAITVDRSGYLQGYLNGVATGQPYVAGANNIAADAGKTLAGTWPVRLGTDGKTNGYRAPFNGTMDEVRIWKTVRTEQELRDNMCHKLSGSETGLLAYYQMNESTGSTITNNATATTGLLDGTIVNGTYWVGSGAPVGDTSINIYASSWVGQSLELTTANRGVFTIDSFGTTGSYLHLYKVNATPDSVTGLTAYSNNDVYFGTFASGDTFKYYPKYNYANYSNAVTYKNTVGFFTRRFNADPSWASKPNVYNHTSLNLMRVDSVSGTRQFFLANFVNNCSIPTALGVSNVQASNATLNWTTGGSALWNIEYGTGGFAHGSGILIKAANINPFILNGLAGNTTYEYYVQDSCTGIGASAWAGPFSFTTTPDYSNFGSGYALHFNGNGVQNSTVQAINLGGVLRDSLATTDFTIEMWVKIGDTNTGNPPLIADKDYVSGGNTGICWTYTASVLWGDAAKHVFRFNFKPAGGTRRDYDMIAVNENTWNHLAITVDRRGFIKGYINGIYMPSSYASGAGSIAADSNKTLAGTMPLYLGTDGTGNYRVPLNGDMDEVRVWNRVRTETELRDDMCHKLKGNEANLLAYYRMDEPAGPTTTNKAALTAGTMDGVSVNNPQHAISTAPIGDTSVNIYPSAGWGGVSLTMSTLDKGTITVDSVLNAGMLGVHIYTVRSAPNFTKGIADIGTTDKYVGVFTADDANAKYLVKYDYNNYTNAVANNANLHLYNRGNNAGRIWTQLPATHNNTTHVFSDRQVLGTRQYLLADFSAISCNTPSALVLNSVDTGNATINWTSSATSHRIKYGLAGFGIDTAATYRVNSNSQSITDLLPATQYEFYIQDSCSLNDSSAWVGPFYFETLNPCPGAENVYADSVDTTSMVVKWIDNGTQTTGYEVSWGVSGSFSDPAVGILQRPVAPRLSLTGLTKNTAYDFYINANCNSSVAKSDWKGPFTFKTDSITTSVKTIAQLERNVRIYPNPAKEKINIDFLNNVSINITGLKMFNTMGTLVYQQKINSTERMLSINTSQFSNGIYIIKLSTSEGDIHQRVLIQN